MEEAGDILSMKGMMEEGITNPRNVGDFCLETGNTLLLTASKKTGSQSYNHMALSSANAMDFSPRAF